MANNIVSAMRVNLAIFFIRFFPFLISPVKSMLTALQQLCRNVKVTDSPPHSSTLAALFGQRRVLVK
jgi:hypothetical protein